MLQRVDVGERSLAAYRGLADDVLLDDLVREAEALRGVRVLHINATPFGGGVSELLRSAVPLLNDLGLVADWQVIHGADSFFEVTKTMHNALQGAERGLDARQREVYLEACARNAADLADERYDVVFVHDPQPAALLELGGSLGAKWVWRCHIDTSDPNPDVWAFLRAYLADYDAAVFTMDEFVPPRVPIERVRAIAPAIDPLSPKNIALPDRLAREILGWMGVRLDRPLLTQVSRFDPWKDPLGVIEAFRLARSRVPTLQLVLAGSMALDDPEAFGIYRRLTEETAADPSMHVFTNLTGVGNIEVNALQRLSDVVVQKSIREGFGLVVSEALWKGTPVVAGKAGGIPMQMPTSVGGYLVESVDECGERIATLLEDPDKARALGERGREHTRTRFLMPRLLLDEVRLIAELVTT